MPVTISTAKNARDNFFMSVTKFAVTQKKPVAKIKNYARDILGTNFFPAPSARPFFILRFCYNYFFGRDNFWKCRDISSKVVCCLWNVPVTFLKKISRDISRMPVTLVKKSACDMPKCPWQFSKSGNVTGKKISREKNTEPKERVASIILCFLLKSGGNKGRMSKEQQITSKD